MWVFVCFLPIISCDGLIQLENSTSVFIVEFIGIKNPAVSLSFYVPFHRAICCSTTVKGN